MTKIEVSGKAAHKRADRAHPVQDEEEGFWQRAGTGYGPKYKSTVWALILLAQLGASVKEDKRSAGLQILSDHALSPRQISAMTNNAPQGTIDCPQGTCFR
jgi:hypothetical protein